MSVRVTVERTNEQLSPGNSSPVQVPSDADWDHLSDLRDRLPDVTTRETRSRRASDPPADVVEPQPALSRRTSSRRRVPAPEPGPHLQQRREREREQEPSRSREPAESRERRRNFDISRRRNSSQHSESVEDQEEYPGQGPRYGGHPAQGPWGYQPPAPAQYPPSIAGSAGYNPFTGAPPMHPSQLVQYDPNEYFAPPMHPSFRHSMAGPPAGYYDPRMSPPAVPMMSPYGFWPPPLMQSPMPQIPPNAVAKDNSIQELTEWFKERERDRIAKDEKKQQEEDEKRRIIEEYKANQEALANAKKEAQAAAEKTAADKAKKAEESHKAALDKANKERDEAKKEAATYKPPDDATQPNIKFKDAVGRKFNFPWKHCKTWDGMERLILQAFEQVVDVGEMVRGGMYDLQGPDGEIILPEVWDSTVKPGWSISMHLWPTQKEPDRPAALPVHSSRRARAPSPPSIWGFGLSRKRSTKKAPARKSPSPPTVQVTESGVSISSGGAPPVPPAAPLPPTGSTAVIVADPVVARSSAAVEGARQKRHRSREPAVLGWVAGGSSRSGKKK